MLIGFLNLLTPIPLLGSLKYPRHSRSYLPLRPPRQTLIICSSLRPPRLTHSFITSQIPQISSIYSPLIILGNCLMGLFHLFLIVQKFSIFFCQNRYFATGYIWSHNHSGICLNLVWMSIYSFFADVDYLYNLSNFEIRQNRFNI